METPLSTNNIKSYFVIFLILIIMVSVINYQREGIKGLLARLIGLMGSVILLVGLYQSSNIVGNIVLLIFSTIWTVTLYGSVVRN